MKLANLYCSVSLHYLLHSNASCVLCCTYSNKLVIDVTLLNSHSFLTALYIHIEPDNFCKIAIIMSYVSEMPEIFSHCAWTCCDLALQIRGNNTLIEALPVLKH